MLQKVCSTEDALGISSTGGFYPTPGIPRDPRSYEAAKLSSGL